MKTELADHIPTPLDKRQRPGDQSRQHHPQRAFSQSADADHTVKNVEPQRILQIAAIERIEKHETRGDEKTQSHIDARAHSLVLIHHRRCENSGAKQRGLAVE